MGIPITVYFLLCIQSTTNYVDALSVLTADLVVVYKPVWRWWWVHWMLEPSVLGFVICWQLRVHQSLVPQNSAGWYDCWAKATLSAVESVYTSTLADSFPSFIYHWNRPIKRIPHSFHSCMLYIYTSVAPLLFTVCHFSSSYLAVRGKYKSKAFKRSIITNNLSTMV